MRVDGNDVLACLAVTREALARARAGGGPTYIEAVTYRMGPHTTADDPTRYRGAHELDAWAARDPLARLAALLDSLGLLQAEYADAVRSRADAVGAELREGCLSMPEPAPSEVFEHVYSEPNSWLERQQDHYERYLAMFGPASPEGPR